MATGKSSRSEQAESRISDREVARWFEDYGDVLYRYARTRVRRLEVAEDLVQETFLAALKARDAYARGSSVQTWLISILRRKIVDHYRSKATEEFHLSSADERINDRAKTWIFTDAGRWRLPPSSWRGPREALEDRELWQVLGECLKRIPGPLASAFVLRELEEMDMVEARSTLNVSAGNLRVRIHRARLLLRHCLEQHGQIEDTGSAMTRGS